MSLNRTGRYLNPQADGFAEILRGPCYVDKTGLISYMNSVMETPQKLVCSTRPRRFGKSFAVQMMVAFYSRGADARELFKGLEVEQKAKNNESDGRLFERYFNRCDVLCWDMARFASRHDANFNPVRELQRELASELCEAFGMDERNVYLPDLLLDISLKTGRKFFILIDEWDALFREYPMDVRLQEEYIALLRDLFKGIQISRYLIGAYMTGILPIKKYGTQSALTDFNEFTMLEPDWLAPFVGFTEREVKDLCRHWRLDFDEARRWYDGYFFDRIGHIYCPNSMIKAVLSQRFRSYWTQTETYESLQTFIDMNFEGLRDEIVSMLGGHSSKVDAQSFRNDLSSVKSRDDVFTLLVHLGYLAYESSKESVYIPNEEIRAEFVRAIRNGSRTELVKAIQISDRILQAVLRMDSDAVAELLGEIHIARTTPDFYNNEQALRSVVAMAFLTAEDDYRRFEEIAGGRGYADMLFLPKKRAEYPAILIELKWDKPVEAALNQVKEKRYADAAKRLGYKGELLVVGVAYSTKTAKHVCRIEKTSV